MIVGFFWPRICTKLGVLHDTIMRQKLYLYVLFTESAPRPIQSSSCNVPYPCNLCEASHWPTPIT